MKAPVYHGPDKKAWEDAPKPAIHDEGGRTLGHEAVGTVDEIGAAAKAEKVADRVLVSCVSAYAVCHFCR